VQQGRLTDISIELPLKCILVFKIYPIFAENQIKTIISGKETVLLN